MIPLFKVRMHENAVKRAAKVLSSGYIGQGPVVDEFEDALKDYFDYPYILTTNSATSAEHLALHMLRKEHEGCEVLCTPLTSSATNWPVILNGYKIKWVDVNTYNFNMDMYDLINKLSPTTKISYAVAWGGHPINYMELNEVFSECEQKHGFSPVLIEDCANAMGSKNCGYHLGTSSVSQYATYSFQAIKHVTSIDGGALICPDKETYERAKLLRWYGLDRKNHMEFMRCKNDIPEAGFKFHMNDVSAAVGVENLKTLGPALLKTKQCAKFYDTQIKSELVTKIPFDPNCAYWLYTILVERRDDFEKHMTENGIMTSRVHERNDKNSCVSEFKTNLPNLEKVMENIICIPCGWWLSDDEKQHIVNTINEEGW